MERLNVLFIRKQLLLTICLRFRQDGMYHTRLEINYLNFFLQKNGPLYCSIYLVLLSELIINIIENIYKFKKQIEPVFRLSFMICN